MSLKAKIAMNFAPILTLCKILRRYSSLNVVFQDVFKYVKGSQDDIKNVR